MAQTTITTVPSAALLGMLADAGPLDKISRIANGALYLGCLCVFGTEPDGAGSGGLVQEITDAAAALVNLAGVPIWESGKEPFSIANGKSQIADKSVVSIMRYGRIWAYTETAADSTSVVYARVLTVSTDVKGQLRAGAAANFVAVPNAKFVSKTTGAGLIQLELS